MCDGMSYDVLEGVDSQPTQDVLDSRSDVVKRNIGIVSALALFVVTMLGACAAPDGGAGSASRASGTGKVEAYGVIDGGVTIVK
ncbi:hypothetical protein DBA20_26590 [Pandoraea capi]|uniref:Uncharacterized protein n=1 Tax=Pandoraea capi TaxID=2508286 RepID=A0ABY6W5G7_9BURK|nr:hypothetical protein [Pandoraea sp. LA3]MDN4586560.1 hypothetical protein [Pandoraea capi]VVE28602.1 hypothetical protein PCA20602_03529 [Pandoraea capi]